MVTFFAFFFPAVRALFFAPYSHHAVAAFLVFCHVTVVVGGLFDLFPIFVYADVFLFGFVPVLHVDPVVFCPADPVPCDGVPAEVGALFQPELWLALSLRGAQGVTGSDGGAGGEPAVLFNYGDGGASPCQYPDGAVLVHGCHPGIAALPYEFLFAGVPRGDGCFCGGGAAHGQVFQFFCIGYAE